MEESRQGQSQQRGLDLEPELQAILQVAQKESSMRTSHSEVEPKD